MKKILAVIGNHSMWRKKTNVVLIAVVILALVLRVYKLSELMPFIGDYGWFYVSARDMLLTHRISLVGITASHTWLHQGPLWIYVLAILLKLFQFNPLVGGYFVAIIGSVSILLIYKLGTELISERVGILSAFLYATSPLVIIHSRIPYHTSLIPFFTIFFLYATYKWVSNDTRYFPLIFLFFGVLYNLELATVILFLFFVGVFLYGVIYKKEYVSRALNKKILLISLLAFTVPMIPVLIYDLNHGFPQTIKFSGWILYKLSFISFFIKGGSPVDSIFAFHSFLYEFGRRLVFMDNAYAAISLLLLSFIYLVYARKNAVLLVFLFGSLLGLLVTGPSEAYLPILFPQIILCIALFFDFIASKFGNVSISVIVIVISLFNINSLIGTNYLTGERIGYGVSFSKRLNISKQIIDTTQGKEYNLSGRGDGDKFESYIMGYEYLTWWLGNGPSKNKTDLQVIVLNPDRNPQIEIVSSKKP